MKRFFSLLVALVMLASSALAEGIIADRFYLWNTVGWKSTFGTLTRDIDYSMLLHFERTNGEIRVMVEPTDEVREYVTEIYGEEILTHLSAVYYFFDETERRVVKVSLFLSNDDPDVDLFQKTCQSIEDHYFTGPYEQTESYAAWCFWDFRTELSVSSSTGEELNFGDASQVVTINYIDRDYYMDEDGAETEATQ